MRKINELSPDSQKYIQIVTHIAQSPKRLWFVGKLPNGRLPSVAIVGTRKPTAYGREMAYTLSYGLAARGIVIISGLALGIDGIAHQAALDAGGTTIAVLPTSLQAIYPRAHQTLAEKIVEGGGALVTEYPIGSTTHRGNFLERNRIVSGLSDGVLIIEAAARSGTLATANFALDQGKPVMAVPGNSTSPMSAGCNHLIKMGATMVTGEEDVLHELNLNTTTKPETLPLANSPEEKTLLQLIAQGTRDGEELQRQSGFEPSLFGQTLTMLELEQKIRPLGANTWTIN